MATAVCGSANRAAPDQFLGSAEIRRFVGSDVVSVSPTGHIEATDYVGQASRRYRRNRFQSPTNPAGTSSRRILRGRCSEWPTAGQFCIVRGQRSRLPGHKRASSCSLPATRGCVSRQQTKRFGQLQPCEVPHSVHTPHAPARITFVLPQ